MRRRLALAAILLTVSACHGDDNAILLVVVTASGSPRAVTVLDVTLTGRAGKALNSYSRDDQQPIAFPTTFSADLPEYATGSISIEVRAKDGAGATVAMGRGGPITLNPGDHETIYVRLDCDGEPCVITGGTGGAGGDGNPPLSPSCGNGRIDPGETCDTRIAAGDPGACPPTCDDHIPCTRDTRTGSDCTVSCAHVEILEMAADGCCPAGLQDKDPDCFQSCRNGIVDPGETCDLTIPHGAAGACPTDCAPGAPCAIGMLVSAGTCSAICARYPIVTTSGKFPDTCCPPGATNAVDSDCPALCGNGKVDSDESCDVGIPARAPGACPTTCDDGDSCTIDYFSTVACQSGCQHFKIRAKVSGDGCCPDGATHATDTDCPAACGDGNIDPGEACDGNCPTYCKPTPSACLRTELVGSPDDCTAHCVMSEATTCELEKDGCCPAGCTSATDGDCSFLCGDGFIQTSLGEVCEINVGPTMPAPARCPVSCADDGNACTEERLLSAGTCAAICVRVPIMEMRPGDGCCPQIPGTLVNFSLDPDCDPICGNGIVERPVEICDYAAATPATTESPGSDGCPASCPSDAACTRYVLQGSGATCSASCVAMPITACADADGCCPAGCTMASDSDCAALCGDGVVGDNESCDRAITAGFPGACPRTCNDGNACTLDFASGSPEACTRACIHQPMAGCLSDDGCCPDGCNADNDSDCNPQCGDKHIQGGETCDPPSTCPTTCPDDGDPCTAEQLTGSAATCSAACRHVPITACSGNDRDACCPTGCTAASDWDC